MPSDDFDQERQQAIEALARDDSGKRLSLEWFLHSAKMKYSYNFSWLGRPIIQYPQDIVAVQEIIWDVKPDIIIETGIARGGSIVFYASMLELLGGDRKVVGIDIDIREHNRLAIDQHFLRKRIELVEGSSTDDAVIQKVRGFASGKEQVLVVLDSNHTHDHVLAELQAYSPLVTKGSYLIVFDTVVASMPDTFFPDRPWGPGDNPATAVAQFLKETDRFEVDEMIDAKLQISVAPRGYLRCVKD